MFGLVEIIIRKKTGFEAKTLWDWMELLIIPVFLAGGVFFLNRSDRKIEREISIDRQRESILQSYFDQIAELLLKEKLRTTKRKEVRDLARVRTLSALRGLDNNQKLLLIKFLQEANLINAKKPIIDLQGADLSHSDFSDAYLVGVNLSGANLKYAVLIAANLDNANLSEANLDHADLTYAYLDNVNLSKARLGEASLLAVDLNNANLSGANLNKSDLSNVFLIGADLSNANLNGSDLDMAILRNANLNGASLSGANLSSVDFTGANLHNASLNVLFPNFPNLPLDGANLTGAKISEEQLGKVKSLKGVIMPNGTKHE